jgi:hypothetical protein
MTEFEPQATYFQSSGRARIALLITSMISLSILAKTCFAALFKHWEETSGLRGRYEGARHGRAEAVTGAKTG